MTNAAPIVMTHEEWINEAKTRFGKAPRGWKFVCPVCGYVQSINTFLELTDLSKDAILNVIAFSCVGRWVDEPASGFDTSSSPCDYAGGGLFRLNPVTVTLDGKNHQRFEFA